MSCRTFLEGSPSEWVVRVWDREPDQSRTSRGALEEESVRAACVVAQRCGKPAASAQGHDRHAILHALAYELSHELYSALTGQDAFGRDMTAYRARLRTLCRPGRHAPDKARYAVSRASDDRVMVSVDLVELDDLPPRLLLGAGAVEAAEK